MRRFSICLICVALAACGVQPEPPAISHISDADGVVRVQARSMGNPFIDDWPEKLEILDAAERGCRLYGKFATFLSVTCTLRTTGLFAGCMRAEYLFACATEEQYREAAKEWAAKEPIMKKPKARPVQNRKGECEATPEYRECMRGKPSDWCRSWYCPGESPAAGFPSKD